MGIGSNLKFSNRVRARSSGRILSEQMDHVPEKTLSVFGTEARVTSFRFAGNPPHRFNKPLCENREQQEIALLIVLPGYFSTQDSAVLHRKQLTAMQPTRICLQEYIRRPKRSKFEK